MILRRLVLSGLATVYLAVPLSASAAMTPSKGKTSPAPAPEEGCPGGERKKQRDAAVPQPSRLLLANGDRHILVELWIRLKAIAQFVGRNIAATGRCGICKSCVSSFRATVRKLSTAERVETPVRGQGSRKAQSTVALTAEGRKRAVDLFGPPPAPFGDYTAIETELTHFTQRVLDQLEESDGHDVPTEFS